MSTSGSRPVQPGVTSGAGTSLDAPPPTRPIQRVSGPPAAGPKAPTATDPTRPAGPAGERPSGAPGKQGPAGSPGPPRPAVAAKTARPTVRRVRLAVTRIDPWSAMKMSFLLSFAAAVGLVVMTAVLWMVLSGMSVFSDIDGLVRDLQPTTAASPFTIMDYIAFPRVMALSMVVGVVDIVLLTALGTIGAYLYNLSAALVGGVQLTLTDE